MAKPASDRLDMNELAVLLRLPEMDEVLDDNDGYIYDQPTDADMEAASKEVADAWYRGVESAAETLFEEHQLKLVAPGHKKWTGDPFTLQVVPVTTWNAAADAIRETINGVGEFHFNSLHEFLSSGPYTARQAVLGHLHWIKEYPGVYGTTSAKRLYDQAWR